MKLSEFDPFAVEYTAKPKPFFAECHRSAPLFRHDALGTWFAHGHEEVKTFLTHPDVDFNSDLIPGYTEGAAARMERWPFTESSRANSGFGDPVKHQQMRKLLAPDFKPSMIRRMTATVQDVVAKHCAPLQSASEVDVVELVQEVPLTTISRILGIDEASPAARVFLDSAPDFFRGSNPLSPDELRDQAEVAAIRMNEVLSEVVEERRAHPQEDLISQTLEAAQAIGTFSNEEICNLLVILVAAGTDTTRLASSLAIKTLIACPEERELLRADRSLLDAAVLELLRYESPTKFLARIPAVDLEIGAHTVPRGSMVLLSPFAAGLDPKVFPTPIASTRVARPGASSPSAWERTIASACTWPNNRSARSSRSSSTTCRSMRAWTWMPSSGIRRTCFCANSHACRCSFARAHQPQAHTRSIGQARRRRESGENALQ